MQGHLAAMLAVLFDFQALRSKFLVFSGMVIDILANRAFQLDQVIL